MDPNATLLQIREAVTNNDFETAAQLFDGLDHWLTCGGFLPSSWERLVQKHSDQCLLFEGHDGDCVGVHHKRP